MNNIEITAQMKQATYGLLLESESEYPFEVFYWESPALIPLTEAKLLQQTGHPADTPIKIVELNDFFRVATEEQQWYTPQEKDTLEKYQTLLQTLKNCLSDIKVYRLGAIEIDVYIVGITASGHLAGLSTKVVET